MFPWTEGLLNKSKNPDTKKEVTDKNVPEKREIPDTILNAILFDHPYNQVKTDSNVAMKEEAGMMQKEDEIEGPTESNIFESLLCGEKSFLELAAENNINELHTSKVSSPASNDASVNLDEVGKAKFQDEKSDEETRSDMASEKCEMLDNDDVVSSSKNSIFDDDNSQDGESASLQGNIRTAKHVSLFVITSFDNL